jgi:hypothetical protein
MKMLKNVIRPSTWARTHTLLNENVIVVGIYTGCSLIGPVIGYLGGGAILRVYGDFLTTDMKT